MSTPPSRRDWTSVYAAVSTVFFVLGALQTMFTDADGSGWGFMIGGALIIVGAIVLTPRKRDG